MDAGLKDLKVKDAGKQVAGSEFQSLEVIGIKELAKTLIRFLSNLTAKGCWAFENRVLLVNSALGGSLISSRLNRHRDSICSTGKGQKWFFGEPGSRVS